MALYQYISVLSMGIRPVFASLRPSLLGLYHCIFIAQRARKKVCQWSWCYNEHATDTTVQLDLIFIGITGNPYVFLGRNQILSIANGINAVNKSVICSKKCEVNTIKIRFIRPRCEAWFRSYNMFTITGRTESVIAYHIWQSINL